MGVLHRLINMLVVLYDLRPLLREGGTLLATSHPVHDDDHSYANSGRLRAGKWRQPTTLCVKDRVR